jgi:hypothetical protein
LEARVIVTSYNQHVRLLSPEPWLVGTTKVYSGLGADIVMESLHSLTYSLPCGTGGIASCSPGQRGRGFRLKETRWTIALSGLVGCADPYERLAPPALKCPRHHPGTAIGGAARPR